MNGPPHVSLSPQRAQQRRPTISQTDDGRGNQAESRPEEGEGGTMGEEEEGGEEEEEEEGEEGACLTAPQVAPDKMNRNRLRSQ